MPNRIWSEELKDWIMIDEARFALQTKVVDVKGYYGSDHVEGCLEEIGNKMEELNERIIHMEESGAVSGENTPILINEDQSNTSEDCIRVRYNIETVSETETIVTIETDNQEEKVEEFMKENTLSNVHTIKILTVDNNPKFSEVTNNLIGKCLIIYLINSLK